MLPRRPSASDLKWLGGQTWFLDASKLLEAVEKLWITGALDRHPKMATPRETASVLALAVVAVGPATSRYTMPRIAV
jgi:hypothetical protein